MPRLMTPLNEILQRQLFLVGGKFTVADIAVGSVLSFIPIMLKIDLSSYPAVFTYMKRLSERPAFQATIGSRR